MFYIDDDVFESRKKLTPAVLQIAELLGLYNAELARALGLRCQDIGELSSPKIYLEEDTPAWQRARLLVRLYQWLFRQMEGDAIAMYRWLRVDNRQLNGIPLLLIVDEDRIEWLVDTLYSQMAHQSAD